MKRIVSVFGLLFLSACGGGGSSTSPTAQFAGIWGLSGTGEVSVSEATNPSSMIPALAQFSGSLNLLADGACGGQVVFTLQGNNFIGLSFNGQPAPPFSISEVLTGPELHPICTWTLDSQGRASITFSDFKPNIVVVGSFQSGGTLEVVNFGPISLS